MATIVNGKIIRSLPEQVNQNTKRIEQIEAERSLYRYIFYIEATGGDYFYGTLITQENLNVGDYDDDAVSLFPILKRNGEHFIVNGKCTGGIIVEAYIYDDRYVFYDEALTEYNLYTYDVNSCYIGNKVKLL